jgi:branched-subunit amino acid transport protein AzlD
MTRLLLTVAAMTIVTVLTRAAPFLFFSRRKPPAALDYLQAYLPPALMTILVLSAFKDVAWSDFPHGAPAVAGAVVTALVHLAKRNVLLSIACGTAAYIALTRILT